MKREETQQKICTEKRESENHIHEARMLGGFVFETKKKELGLNNRIQRQVISFESSNRAVCGAEDRDRLHALFLFVYIFKPISKEVTLTKKREKNL